MHHGVAVLYIATKHELQSSAVMAFLRDRLERYQPRFRFKSNAIKRIKAFSVNQMIFSMLNWEIEEGRGLMPLMGQYTPLLLLFHVLQVL